MGVLEKLNISIGDAEQAGLIDRTRQGAVIEAAQKVAMVMDDPDWPMIRGKIDNVSPSVFLKYCEKLGIAGIEVSKEPDKKPLRIVGNSKWKKQA